MFVMVVGVAVASPVTRREEETRCGGEFMAKYNLTIETFWSRDVFTKQYPLFRPHAQWSKLVGRSHDDLYTMWRVGDLAKPAVKLYAEKGESSLLDQEVQGTHGVLDSFAAGPISESGVGKASSKFLVDENHSKLSTIMRIVPSPDWFVGIDSLELCEGGQWLERRTLDVDPHDAGTDRGFTFTAPNWPETPHKPVSLITSQMPNHPANSFYYPELDSLPRLARVYITRVDMESTTEHQPEAGIQEEEEMWDVSSSSSSSEEVEVADALPAQKVHHRQPLVAVVRQTPMFRTRTSSVASHEATKVSPTTTTTDVPSTTTTTATTTEEPTTVRRSLFSDMAARKERRRNRKNNRNNRKDRRNRKQKGLSGPRIHCEVGEWSAWGPCSKTCGYGNKLRIRVATVEPKNAGLPCPPLREEQICGSMRSCNWNHFGGFSWGTGDTN